jgi:hypothetical protein
MSDLVMQKAVKMCRYVVDQCPRQARVQVYLSTLLRDLIDWDRDTLGWQRSEVKLKNETTGIDSGFVKPIHGTRLEDL